MTRVAEIYAALAIVAAIVTTIGWVRRTQFPRPTPQLVANHTQRVNVAAAVGRRRLASGVARWAAMLPGNEILQLSIHEKQIVLPRMDEALNGLSIAHLSDLHFTGHIDQTYFDEVVDQTNALEADFVAITGDIIDRARCLDWIPVTLGRLKAPAGVFFVLGNHELRVRDEAAVRRTLTTAGLVDLGADWRLLTVSGCPIIVAGNERPWFRRAADLTEAPEIVDGHRPLRVLLTHTPDQLHWARRHDMDLMLAGHTHGGQVRFPLIGPILAPSLHGVKHSAGTFFCSPTLLHVSRGISGTRPIRYNCPPELTKLVLSRDNVPSGVPAGR